MTRAPIDRLKAEIDWFSAHKIEFVYCCDANYGILPRDVEISEDLAKSKQLTGYPKFCSVQNAKNATDRTYLAQKILNDAGMNKGVTLGIQSLNPKTLQDIARDNISLETYHELQRRFASDGVPTYTDLILGLPGETYDSWVDGICELITRGQHGRIQTNNLSILPNAAMADQAYQQKHGMVMVDADIVNIHGKLESEEVQERQRLVVGTSAMPPPDWVLARKFGWWVSLLHFDKLMQLPIIVLHEVGGIPYREIFEEFTRSYPARSPMSVVAGIDHFFQTEALRIQAGGAEYVRSPEYLGIWWPQDEHVFIKLARESLLPNFYADSEKCLKRLLERRGQLNLMPVLDDAVLLNQSSLKLPLSEVPTNKAGLGNNVLEIYQGGLRGVPAALAHENTEYIIDQTQQWDTWDTWEREVIWHGNKAGKYLREIRRA